MRENLENTVENLVKPIVEELGFELYDVEFISKREESELVITIDKEGGINLDDCEKVSRAVDEPLEVADIIEEAYFMTVSSVGIDRQLKKEKDYKRALGSMIDIKLFAKVNGKKEFCGILKDFGEAITLEVKGKDMVFENKQVAIARMHVEFK